MNDKNLSNLTIAIVGCGNLGRSIIGGILNNTSGLPKRLLLGHPRHDDIEEFVSKSSITSACNLSEAVEQSDVVVLSVKPNSFKSVLGDIKSRYTSSTPLLLSVAAGVTIRNIASAINADDPNVVRVARAMPNLCAAIQKSVTGIFSPAAQDAKLAALVCSSFGSTVILDEEKLINSTIGAAGSSPAFIATFAASLIKAAIESGLSESAAREMVLETIQHTAELLRISGESPASLASRVASPGGTTLAGLKKLAEGNFEKIVKEAAQASISRAEELSGEIDI